MTRGAIGSGSDLRHLCRLDPSLNVLRPVQNLVGGFERNGPAARGRKPRKRVLGDGVALRNLPPG